MRTRDSEMHTNPHKKRNLTQDKSEADLQPTKSKKDHTKNKHRLRKNLLITKKNHLR